VEKKSEVKSRAKKMGGAEGPPPRLAGGGEAKKRGFAGGASAPPLFAQKKMSGAMGEAKLGGASHTGYRPPLRSPLRFAALPVGSAAKRGRQWGSV
jgi:hypothetical protein